MPTGYTVDEEKKKRIIEAHVKHKIPVSELAKGYNVNRKTIYKWLKEAEGDKPMSAAPATQEPKAPEQPAPEQTTAEPAPANTEQVDTTQTETPQPAPESVLAEAKAEAEKLLADAKDEATKLVEDAKAEVEKLKADAQAEVAKLAGDAQSAAPAEEPVTETPCPNPSCDAQFSGDECPSCGFKQSAMVNPLATSK